MVKFKIIKDNSGKIISSKSIGKTNKIVLTQKESEEVVPEYYTYIDSNGNEQKYTGIISRSSDNVYGKSFEQHKVKLEYHPGVKQVNGNDEYFSYTDMSGVERMYTDDIEFDEKSNSYVGKIPSVKVTNKVIDIFEEK
jgi:hypothetical protein